MRIEGIEQRPPKWVRILVNEYKYQCVSLVRPRFRPTCFLWPSAWRHEMRIEGIEQRPPKKGNQSEDRQRRSPPQREDWCRGCRPVSPSGGYRESQDRLPGKWKQRLNDEAVSTEAIEVEAVLVQGEAPFSSRLRLISRPNDQTVQTDLSREMPFSYLTGTRQTRWSCFELLSPCASR